MVSQVVTAGSGLVVYANRKQAKEGEELKILKAGVSYSRTQPTAPFSENFESGSLDQFFRFGEKTTSITSNQAREGTRALQIDVDSNSWCEQCDPESSQREAKSIRRAEISPSDWRGSGGFPGEDRWYGWSVFFPESFKAPPVEGSYFDGKIDEVRIYNQALNESQIKIDEAGEYEKTGATPVAAYSFNENKEGIATDSTPGHHNGTIKGAEWTTGKYGSALDFSQTGDEVEIPDANDLDLTKTFTLEAWVDPVSLRWWKAVLGKTEGPKGESGYVLNAGNEGDVDGEPGGNIYSHGTIAKAVSFHPIPTNSWSHLAVTSNRTTLKIYVNGKIEAEKPAIEAAPNAANLTIGTNAANLNPEPTGNWDIFTQWHHDTHGIECNTDTSIPIAFSAIYWRANSWVNPGETKKVPSADGDYIEAFFNGGQVEDTGGGACHSLKPTQRYILAPIERGQWYDFVVHTRWTTEEGGPGNSITSVWINGKQVLGNQTNPVWKPTLYWKGTPEVHNPEETWHFGLYRGPSAEDPTTRLFVDSAKSGESYAEVAPEVHAPRVEAESYSATLKGKGLKTLTTSFGPFECSETGLQGTETNTTRQAVLSAEYGSCTATGSKYFSTVTMNSCHYNLGVRNVGPPYAGNWGVACEKESDAIEFKAFSTAGGTLLCTAKVGPQSGLGGLGLSNSGEGAKRAVAVHAEVKGIKYELNGGSSCKTPEVRADGIFSGETTLTATNGKAEQIGFHLTGDEFVPHVEIESYPGTLKGGGLETFTGKGGSVTCSESSLQSVIGNASTELSLMPTYGSCKASGFTTTASLNGCHYTLGVKNASPLYTGTWGIACKNPGEVIEFDVLFKSSIICKVKLGAQEGLARIRHFHLGGCSSPA